MLFRLPLLLLVGCIACTAAQASESTRQDVAPLDLGLSFIEALKPQSYRMSNNPGRVNFGFSEAEMQAALGTRWTYLVREEHGRLVYASADRLSLSAPAFSAAAPARG